MAGVGTTLLGARQRQNVQNMGRKIGHMGMTMTGQEHERWHKKDRVAPKDPGKPGHKQINCYAIGGGFLGYCVKKGWLIQEGKGRNAKYYVTKDGEKELKKFGIDV